MLQGFTDQVNPDRTVKPIVGKRGGTVRRWIGAPGGRLA